MYACKKCIEWKCYYKKAISLFFKTISWFWSTFSNFVHKRYVFNHIYFEDLHKMIKTLQRWNSYILMHLTKLNFLHMVKSLQWAMYIFNMLRKALLIHLLHRLLDSKEHCGSREIIHKISSMDTSNIKGSKRSLFHVFCHLNYFDKTENTGGKKPGHKTKH